MDAATSSFGLPNDLESTISIATSPFLEKVLEVMQVRPSWQSYLLGLMISKEDYDFITVFEVLNEAERKEMLSTPEAQLQFAKTFSTLIDSISKEQTTQYVMTLLDNTLREDKRRVDYLKLQWPEQKEPVTAQFLTMLTRSNPFIIHQASRVIAKICCWSITRMKGDDLAFYLVWLKNQLVSERGENQIYLQTACRCLQMVLRIEEYRHAFVRLNGLSAMIALLNEAKLAFQIQYQLGFCLWLMTFTPSLADSISNKILIPRMVEIVYTAKKDKVIRILLMLIRNLLEKPTSESIRKENSRSLLACQFYRKLTVLEGKKIEDNEITEDLKALKDILDVDLEEITSFEEYSMEVRSGCLSWSPVHKSEKFWNENVERLNENNLELIKVLVGIVRTGKDNLTVSIALHDIGQYVRHYPKGRLVMDKLDGKEAVMELLNHKHSGVRYQALVCIQRLMVQNIDFLNRQSRFDQMLPTGTDQSSAVQTSTL